jgi:hypothetical protein
MLPRLKAMLEKAEYILERITAEYPNNQEAITAAQDVVDGLKAEIERLADE